MMHFFAKTFGDLLEPFSYTLPTIGDMWSRKKQVFVLGDERYKHNVEEGVSIIWPRASISQPWADTRSPEKLVSFLTTQNMWVHVFLEWWCLGGWGDGLTYGLTGALVCPSATRSNLGRPTTSSPLRCSTLSGVSWRGQQYLVRSERVRKRPTHHPFRRLSPCINTFGLLLHQLLLLIECIYFKFIIIQY